MFFRLLNCVIQRFKLSCFLPAWLTLIYRHRWHMLVGALLGYAAVLDSLTLLAWMSPALIGLWLAVPLSAMTGSERLGLWVKRLQILATAEEVCAKAQPRLVISP
jgi:membrane glycosyltransferase